jgi:hypothetical protein
MTDCIAPDEIKDWQLDAYRDGERDPAVVRHVARCSACAGQVAAPDPTDRRLSAALFRFTCPTVDDLLHYQWGWLPQTQATAVAQHIADCPHCAAEAARLAPPPADETHPQPTGTPAERLRVFVARLLPGGASLAPAPVRATPESPKAQPVRGRPMAVQYYTIDALDWDVTLTWTAGPGAAFTLQGQLLGPTPEEMAGGQAELVQHPLTAALDADGVFILSPVPPGEHALRLRVAQTEIQIPDVKPG